MHTRAVWLIDSDAPRRTARAEALRASGLVVTPVASIADIVKWPSGDVMVTDERRFTSWWKEVGVARVIVLADTAAPDNADRFSDADAWLPQSCRDEDLARVIWNFAQRH